MNVLRYSGSMFWCVNNRAYNAVFNMKFDLNVIVLGFFNLTSDLQLFNEGSITHKLWATTNQCIVMFAIFKQAFMQTMQLWHCVLLLLLSYCNNMAFNNGFLWYANYGGIDDMQARTVKLACMSWWYRQYATRDDKVVWMSSWYQNAWL